MNFVPVDSGDPVHLALLYDLLRERKPEESISHKEMPTWDEHAMFVISRPYLEWYMLKSDVHLVGATYLSKQYEIGVGVLERERGRGYGAQAIQWWIERYPEAKLFANINPQNGRSQSLFLRAGFRHIQHTYAREP